MDAVVLAAGRNDRLKGYVPAYMKPLILINGEPLILTLVQDLRDVLGGSVVVVVAPQNAEHIVDVMSARMDLKDVHFTIQPRATGPAGALSAGMRLVQDGGVMIVCADNVIPKQDIRNAANEYKVTQKTTVVTRQIPAEEARRFTRVTNEGAVEGAAFQVGEKDLTYYQCWVGPVVFHAWDLRAALDEREATLISPLIDSCTPLKLVAGNTTDIGVPEALT